MPAERATVMAVGSVTADGCRVRPVAVLGLGNVLLGDDAFGPFVTQTLEARYEMHDDVEILDLGTPGLDLVPHLAGRTAVIVVDSVNGAGEPGTVRTYGKAELKARGPLPRTNPHQPTLADTLFLLDVQDLAPEEVLLVGCVPARYDTGAPLSVRARAAVPDAMNLVVRELERLGVPPTPRECPLPPAIWWERRDGERLPEEV